MLENNEKATFNIRIPCNPLQSHPFFTQLTRSKPFKGARGVSPTFGQSRSAGCFGLHCANSIKRDKKDDLTSLIEDPLQED